MYSVGRYWMSNSGTPEYPLSAEKEEVRVLFSGGWGAVLEVVVVTGAAGAEDLGLVDSFLLQVEVWVLK